MPERQIDIDMAMHELGQRLRAGWDKRRELSENAIEAAKEAVREQWKMETELAREKTQDPPTILDNERKPDRSDLDR